MNKLVGESKSCTRCSDDADGKVKYEFEDGTKLFWYCQDCAESMHEHYHIDQVIRGDIEL